MKNDSAFPTAKLDSGKCLNYGGLTKREYFAGLALMGGARWSDDNNREVMVRDAVRLADALIDELSKSESETK